MKIKRSGFSILDNEQDKSGATNVRRWRVFRSTVAFALQEAFPLDFLTILWQPSLKGQARFLERIINDISTKAAARKHNLAIQAIPVEFGDPFNLQDCFHVLWETLQAEENEDSQTFFNLNNGTHTMQMAMFLLAKYRPAGLPVNLLQVFRDRGVVELPAANTYLAQARRLDLAWETLKPLMQQVRKEKEEIYQSISIKNSHHPDVERLFREIVDIGCYTDDLILLTGPTGSGKSRIAEEIHRGWSKRKRRTCALFFELNAAGLSGDLIRSTLFGHVQGSFTGAYEDRDGFLLAAHQGTLFLDEIAELDLRSQAELLLAIETKTFFPVGSTQKKNSDFRLICATNKDLQKMVQKGVFREDLYTRIRCWEFKLPQICDLSLDFEENVDYEIKLNNSEEFRKGNPHPVQVFFNEKAKRKYLSFGMSAEAPWTGNFRDLKFSIRRMTIKARLKESNITIELVEEEILRLKNLWEYSSVPPISDPNHLILGIENLARASHPTKNLIDALEAIFLTNGLTKHANKARTAKWLYEAPEKPMKNPSNRFRERFRSLFP